MSRIPLGLPNAYKQMCFDRNINGNRDVTLLGCNYLLVQPCVQLTLKKQCFSNVCTGCLISI